MNGLDYSRAVNKSAITMGAWWKERAILLILVGVYALWVNMYYLWIVQYFAGVPGFDAHPPNYHALGVASLSCLTAALFTPLRMSRFSDGLLAYLFIFMYIPGVFIKTYLLKYYSYINLLYDVSITICYVMLCSFRLSIKLLLVHLHWKIYAAVVLSLLLASVTFVFLEFGFTMRTLSLLDVYSARLEFSEDLATVHPLVRYAVYWSGYSIGPLCMLIGLFLIFSKRVFGLGTVLVLCAVLSQVYLFLFTGLKSVILLMPFIVLLYFYFSKNNRFYSLILIIFTLISLSYLLYLSGYDFGLALWARRLLITSGINEAYHIDLFEDHPYTYYGHTNWGRFLGAEPSPSSFSLVGWLYYGNARTSANAGFWVDAFANLGFAGVFLITFVLWIFLCVLDSVSIAVPSQIKLSLAGVFGYLLSFSGLFTVINTYGLIISIFLMWLLPRSHGQVRSL